MQRVVQYGFLLGLPFQDLGAPKMEKAVENLDRAIFK